MGTGFTLSGAGTPVTLSPAQKMTIGVQFSPSAAGNDAGTVIIASNATGSPATITLSGTGVAPTQHSVSLSWDASTSTVSGYNIYRSTVSGSGYAKVNSSLDGSLSFTDSSVQSGQTYYYVTTAVDSSGDESAYSNEVQANIP
jgi:fibronectin type 3 domain-containing protein